MQNFMLDHEAPIRLGFFFGSLLFMNLWEVISPRRELTTAKGTRWFANLGLVTIDTLALRLLLPLQAAGMVLYAANHGWGILNSVTLPQWFKITLGVLSLDLVIYLQHAKFHTIPFFWRFHSWRPLPVFHELLPPVFPWLRVQVKPDPARLEPVR